MVKNTLALIVVFALLIPSVVAAAPVGPERRAALLQLENISEPRTHRTVSIPADAAPRAATVYASTRLQLQPCPQCCAAAAYATLFGLDVDHVMQQVERVEGGPHAPDARISWATLDAAFPQYHTVTVEACDRLGRVPRYSILSYAGHAWVYLGYEAGVVYVYNSLNGATETLTVGAADAPTIWASVTYGTIEHIPFLVNRLVSTPTEATPRYVPHCNARFILRQ